MTSGLAQEAEEKELVEKEAEEVYRVLTRENQKYIIRVLSTYSYSICPESTSNLYLLISNIDVVDVH